MNPTVLGLQAQGFLNQVPTLIKPAGLPTPVGASRTEEMGLWFRVQGINGLDQYPKKLKVNLPDYIGVIILPKVKGYLVYYKVNKPSSASFPDPSRTTEEQSGHPSCVRSGGTSGQRAGIALCIRGCLRILGFRANVSCCWQKNFVSDILTA